MDGINRALARLRQQDLIREAQRWQRVRDARPRRSAGATLVAARDLWPVALGAFVDEVGYRSVLLSEVI